MADQIKLPIVGETSKGTVFVASLAGIAVLGYAWYKHEKSKTSTTQNSATATAANSYGYGTVSANSYGYGTGANYYGYGGVGAFGSGLEPEYYSYGYGQTSFTNNSQWSTYATQQLENAGYSGTTILAALGLYLTGGTLSSDQVSIVQQAIAVAGYPPSEGTNGYPPNYHAATSTGQSGTTSATGTISVPNVVGQTKGNAHNLIVAAGLTPYDGDWKSGDAGQKVTGQTPSGGTMVAANTKVTYVG